MQERLQKILSARGICSRRKAEEYIEQGFVKVNGEVASIGDKADPEADTIEVDGEVLKDREEMLYYLMYKPVGIVTENIDRDELQVAGCKLQISKKSINHKTVRDLLPDHLKGRIYPVGRLDKDSCGLLLFTNDGALAYRLTHPKFEHEKEYEVITEQNITDGQLHKMRDGLNILGSKTKSARIKRLASNKFLIALTEGRNRQIRRMVQKIGGSVKVLKRVRIMNVEDAALKSGTVRPLRTEEKTELLQSVELLS